jgi:hypothetical protein
MHELIFEASLDELKQGYTEALDRYICVCCGFEVEKGIIYPDNGVLYEAGRFILEHIRTEHGSVLDYLLALDKSATGLTDTQRRLLVLFAKGVSDAEAQKLTGIGSASTIRNHRFMLREKERQARLFLAVMELLDEGLEGSKKAGAGTLSKPKARNNGETESLHGIRNAEDEKLLRKYFPQGELGPLKAIPTNEKHRGPVLLVVAERFEAGLRYTQQQVDDILGGVYKDYALLRRYLVDYRYMDRKADGSEYWRLAPQKGEHRMDRRKELQQLAKEIKTEAGVYEIRNKRNGRVLVDSNRNLKSLNRLEITMELGSHMNAQLQKEWNEMGKDAFEIQVLEILKVPETGYFDEKLELKRLKDKWLRELEPFGEKGYNPEKDRPAPAE